MLAHKKHTASMQSHHLNNEKKQLLTCTLAPFFLKEAFFAGTGRAAVRLWLLSMSINVLPDAISASVISMPCIET